MAGMTTLKLWLARKYHLSMLTTYGKPTWMVSWSASALVAIHYMSHVVTSHRCQQPISGPETVTMLSGWLSSDDVTYVVILVIGGLFK